MTELLGGKRARRQNQQQAAQRQILAKINAKRSPHADRLLSLLQALIKAEDLRLKLYAPAHEWVGRNDRAPQYDWSRNAFTDPELQALNLDFQSTMKRIKKMLSRYRWTPTVRDGEFTGLAVMPMWPKKSADDDRAVWWLINHAARGSSGLSRSLILRFRQCRQCRTWFYALTEHQYHCSERCRQKLHSESPEFRAKRAAYMREKFRPREKMRNKTALESVTKKGR